MKHMLFIAVLLCSPLLPSLPLGAQTRDEKELMAFERDLGAAVMKHHAGRFTDLFADGYYSIDGTTGALHDRAHDLAFINDRSNGFVFFSNTDLDAHVYGGTGVVTGCSTSTQKINGKTVKMNVRFTDVFIRQDGRWKILMNFNSNVTK